MPVIFDFEVGEGFHFPTLFAQYVNRPVSNNRVDLPKTLGDGFIQEVYLDNGLSLCLHHYTLRQEFVLRRAESGETKILTMKFAIGQGHAIELGTSNFFTELKIEPHKEISFLVIVASRQTLLGLLKLGRESSAIEGILRDNPSFVLHEAMTTDMEKTLKQLVQINEATQLPALLYQTKALELIYLLFTKLFARKPAATTSVSQEDVNRIYAVRALILADLSSPPQLADLSRNIGMSPTKMKQLFRQIFGDSIYNYYQTARMNEAANLLGSLSVSEAGYSVGFTNLSHFTRLFERHHQMKPKRYKNTFLKM